MLPEARVPRAALSAAAAAAPRRWPLLKAAAAVFRRCVDTVLYATLATMGFHSLGVVVEVLGRWVCGPGSTVEAAGAAFRSGCWFLARQLLPVATPLLLMRIIQRAAHDGQEQRKGKKKRKKAASNRELPQLPKGFNLGPLYGPAPLYQLMHLAITMKDSEEGSQMWRVGCVLYDVASLGLAISTIFLLRNLVIIVAVPRVKDGDNLMQ